MFEPVFLLTFSLLAILVSWLSSGWKYTTSFWDFFFCYLIPLLLLQLHIMWVSLRKLEIIPGFHFYITEISFKHQLSFLFSLKIELMLLLAILNRLKSFWWYFLTFANNLIYWKVELLQHDNMKLNNQFYWYVKSFLLASLCSIFQLNHLPQLVNTITK